ncbi:MAG: hypothetical protein SFY32_00560 [Bacteroidota bacterium]|nr:hypothetical protein [Bacteroidota bacterium]
MRKVAYIFLVLLVLLYSCSPVNYVQNAPITPCFTKRGQFKANILPSVLNHVEAQVAYSPIKHLGVTGSGYWGFANQKTLNYEGSVFAYIAGDSTFPIGIDLHVGYGKSSFKMQSSTNSFGFSESNYNLLQSESDKKYIQFDFYIITSNSFKSKIGFCNRFSIINFESINIYLEEFNGSGMSSSRYKNYYKYEDKNTEATIVESYLFFTPEFVLLRNNNKTLFLTPFVQIGFSQKLNYNNNSNFYTNKTTGLNNLDESKYIVGNSPAGFDYFMINNFYLNFGIGLGF